MASDAPRSSRLACISVDAYVSGGMAAELLGMRLPNGGAVVPYHRRSEHSGSCRQAAWVRRQLSHRGPQLSLLPAIESHERPKDAYQATLDCSPANLAPRESTSAPRTAFLFCRHWSKSVFWERYRSSRTDLFPELIRHIESRKVLATIYQRPFTQGKVALETLIRYLVEGVKPPPSTKLAPHIVLRSNLGLFLDQVSGPDENEDAG